MSIELKVPSVGESITEAVIGEWLKSEGDWIPQDEPVVVIETDKVNVEVPAPESGTLTKIVMKEGDSAKIGDVIGYMEAGEDSDAEDSDDGGAEESSKEEKAEEKDAESEDEKDAESEDERTEEPRVTPAARRALAQAGLDAADVEATGKGGRVLKEDVLRHVEESESTPAPKEKKESAREAEESAPDAPASGSRREEAVRMTPLRKRVAERLVAAQQGAALLTTFNEIDMSAVIELRKQYKEAFLEKYDVKLGFMSFFVKAAIEALKEIPGVNARIDGDEIVYHDYYDVGVAVGGGKGLVVPVVRNAERLSFAEVEKTIGDLASRALSGKLKLEELQGGTFTISNGGVYGSLLSTPIVNPPQSGILGLHKIEERPVVVAGQVVVRPMMYVALTYDHRVVDGREAVTFLVTVKERIEDPSRILLEV